MAAINLYLKSTLNDGWCGMSESTQTAATTASGWTVGTGFIQHSELESGVERAASTFIATLAPDGSLDTTLKDAFRSENAYNGDFANADWSFHGVVRAASNGGAQDGRVRFRLLKANADGSSATEITSGHQQAAAVTDVSTSADFDSNLTFNPGAFSVANQYLFFQIAWERTGAGGMTSADILFRTGSSSSAGTRVVTADFTPAAATDVFVEGLERIEQGMKPSTAAGMGGVLVERRAKRAFERRRSGLFVPLRGLLLPAHIGAFS